MEISWYNTTDDNGITVSADLCPPQASPPGPVPPKLTRAQKRNARKASCTSSQSAASPPTAAYPGRRGNTLATPDGGPFNSSLDD